MTTPGPVTDRDLNAFLDGELDAVAAAHVTDWLADHPEDAAKVDSYRRQREELHRLFDPTLDEAVPPALTAAFGASTGRVGRPAWMRIAAAILLVAVGAGGGWSARGLLQPPAAGGIAGFVDRAVEAHLVYASEVRHPVEVRADQEAHLVAWLSKRLGHPLRAPNLSGVGYTLIGGRLLPGRDRPAAQFMYQDATGRRVTVYVRPDNSGNTAFRFARERGASAFYWIDAPFAYALTAELPRDKLLSVATAVYDSLSAAPPKTPKGAM